MDTYVLNSATAHIKGGKLFPYIDGVVDFEEYREGVLMTCKINGLPKSQINCRGRFFGFHIHDGNSCAGNYEDEFADVGMHLNPYNCPHPYHMGDLPPLIENNGYAYMSVLLNKFRIQDIVEKAIIIHDMPDDFTTQPSGNSGKKIACGIIERTK